ncbi:MAG: ATP-binding protein [Gammaproteobacteria bacterium]
MTGAGRKARSPYSLRTRLLLVASAVLAAFLGLTGLTLDRAFRDSARAAVDERLHAAVYMLLGVANTRTSGDIAVPIALPDPRLATPDSGFYARIVDGGGKVKWRSLSLVGLNIPFPEPGDIGSARTEEMMGADGTRYFGLSFVVAWEIDRDRVQSYVFQAAESHASFDLAVSRYRRALWGWLAALAAALVAVQAIVLRWALRPLARVVAEVRETEAGTRAELSGGYPEELRALTTHLNELIKSSRSHLTRYRNALADLAHSLKTPLAVVRSSLGEDVDEAAFRALVKEQIGRIDQTVQYQLQRAAASGRTAMSVPVDVGIAVNRVVGSLAKVYAGKRIGFDVEVEEGLAFRGDEGDLLEILGNLIDNAGKWCRRSVRVRAHDAAGRGGFVLEIEDDGPGIPGASIEAVLARGVRADPSTDGHGIGLAVVRELVEGIYHGRLELEAAGTAGTRVRVTVPGSQGPSGEPML